MLSHWREEAAMMIQTSCLLTPNAIKKNTTRRFQSTGRGECGMVSILRTSAVSTAYCHKSMG